MTLSITKLVGHCLIHFSLEARSVFFCRHHLTEHYSVQRGIGGVFCRIHHLCEQSNCPVTTRLSSVAIKSCHRSSFPPHFAPFSKHSPSSSPRIESQINLYLKFNKQFDFEDDMQRTKANFAGCVFGNFQTLAGKKKHNLLINSNHDYCQQDYAFWQSFTLAGGNPNVPHQKSSEARCSVLGKD